MNDAQVLMENAKSDLLRFKQELKDVNVPMELRMDIGSFLSFADFFFDGIVADYLIQSKISDAKAQVTDAIRRIETILRDLRTKM